MDRTIAAWRLHNQRLSAPQAASSADVVTHLLCVQAENPSQSAWAVATRTQEPDAEDLARLLASGEVLRTHVLRPTWHYARRDDLDWLLALTGPRLRRFTGRQLEKDVGLTPRQITELQQLVLDLLTEEPERTRTEIVVALYEASSTLPGLVEGQVDGRAVMLLLAHLEVDRLVCSGRPRDGEHTYALWADRVGARVDLSTFDRDEALARLALRYLSGHGPATVKDLAYWATLTTTDAKRGVALISERLDSFEHDGRTYWHLTGEVAPDPADPVAGEPPGHLLQMLDETYRGYQDSRWVLDADGVAPRGREATMGMALVHSQLVAGMKRTVSGNVVRFDVIPHRPLGEVETAAIEGAAARYGAFLGLSSKVAFDR